MTDAPQRLPPPRLWLPQHWPAWLGLGTIWLIGRLPWRTALRAGAALGGPMHALMRSRRRVAERNVALCFPELDAAARTRLVREHFTDLGRMFAEFALSWMASTRRFAQIPHRVDGLEHLARANARGQGVLLVGAHFSHLELCARLVAQQVPLAGLYREHGSPAFEWAVKRRRLRYASAMFGRKELRATVKHLKQGGALWYAPDQDMRGKDSVFAPFFGIPASTITATHHLARLSGAAVIPFHHYRLPGDEGYAIRLQAPLDGFPSHDAVADTARINTVIETMVRDAPAQYLWIHKRFKTRPPGEPSLYSP